jgi:hypothetical protein
MLLCRPDAYDPIYVALAMHVGSKASEVYKPSLSQDLVCAFLEYASHYIHTAHKK